MHKDRYGNTDPDDNYNFYYYTNPDYHPDIHNNHYALWRYMESGHPGPCVLYAVRACIAGI